MKSISFSKYSGAGNDFILIDHRAPFLSDLALVTLKSFITNICNRQQGIGADGVILLENSLLGADFRMRIFNADGSEAEMCGNGLRTLIKFVDSLGIKKNIYNIETFYSSPKEFHQGTIIDEDVLIAMPPPREIKWSLKLDVAQKPYEVDFIDTGVPHTILFVNSTESINIQELGSTFRHHPSFPKGTNVNFVSYNQIFFSIRTYERGVEGETLACGTGAVATAISIARKMNIKPPITVKVRSNDFLKINFSSSSDFLTVENVTLQGPAKKKFEGLFFFEDYL